MSSTQSQATSGSNCWGQSFTYDRYGNLTGVSSTQCGSPIMSLSVSTKNQVTSPGFAHDDAGNLTSDGALTYTWGAENRFTSAG